MVRRPEDVDFRGRGKVLRRARLAPRERVVKAAEEEVKVIEGAAFSVVLSPSSPLSLGRVALRAKRNCGGSTWRTVLVEETLEENAFSCRSKDQNSP